MKITEFKLLSPLDSLELSCLLMEPETQPKGIVQLVHGMCEHKKRHVPVMEFLVSQGYVCVIHDLRGHGDSARSREELGYLGKDGWNALVEDTKAVNDWVRSKYPGLKVTLLGHSMGSMVVRCFAKRYDDCIDSLIVCGCPSDNPLKGIGKFLAGCIGLVFGWYYRSELLNKMSFGKFNKPFASEGCPKAWVCSDKKIQQENVNDPYCNYIFTANGFFNLTKLMEYCYDSKGWAMKNPSLPIRFISGALDPCRVDDKSIRNAANLMVRVGYSDCELKLYPGMRHEILLEVEKEKVWKDVLHYLA